MMRQRIGKTVFVYLFLFAILTTINNKNFHKFLNFKVINLEIQGLDYETNKYLIKEISKIDLNNILKVNINIFKKTIESVNLVQQFNAFKKYPSTININLEQTELIAQLKFDNNFYLVGANCKLISSPSTNRELPFIFGKPEINQIIRLKSLIDKSSFKYVDIQNLFFYKSGRWDIETKSGLIIKLPETNIKQVLVNIFDIISNKDFIIKKYIDARVSNQIILYE